MKRVKNRNTSSVINEARRHVQPWASICGVKSGRGTVPKHKWWPSFNITPRTPERPKKRVQERQASRMGGRLWMGIQGVLSHAQLGPFLSPIPSRWLTRSLYHVKYEACSLEKTKSESNQTETRNGRPGIRRRPSEIGGRWKCVHSTVTTSILAGGVRCWETHHQNPGKPEDADTWKCQVERRLQCSPMSSLPFLFWLLESSHILAKNTVAYIKTLYPDIYPHLQRLSPEPATFIRRNVLFLCSLSLLWLDVLVLKRRPQPQGQEP